MASFTQEPRDDHLGFRPRSKGRLATNIRPGPCEKHRWGRCAQWNLGGQEVNLLDVAAKDCDILCVQEIARDEPGWGEFDSEQFQWITHRAEGQWRGVGIGVAIDKFDCIIKKVSCSRGMWCLIRIHGLGRVVCGSLHAHTGVTNVVYQAAVHEFFHAMPACWRQYPLVCGVDANETCTLVQGENFSLEAGLGSTNLGVLLHEALQHGCSPLAPHFAQRNDPTHFPRDESRRGRQIDMIISRMIDIGPVTLEPDRRYSIGSDHTILHAEISSKGNKKLRWGNDSRARWVVQDLPSCIIVDDEDVAVLARACSRPRKANSFVDDLPTREAIRAAKISKNPVDWKRAHKLRRKAREAWRKARLKQIVQGSWEDFRHLQNEKKRKRGWWGNMLAEKSSADLSSEVQRHLESKMVDPGMNNWDVILEELITSVKIKDEFVGFSLLDLRTELQGMRCKSAVGPDGIGVHLLRTMASHDDLGPQLLDLINHIVRTQAVPASWNVSFLALLAKVDVPTKPSDLRPICVSSAFNKLVNRLVCSRTLPLMRRGSKVSACGKGRQAADLIGSISRVRDVVREWRCPALLCKLDVAGAFDRVDRRKVAELLLHRLKGRHVSHELRFLLTQLRTHELVGKVPGGQWIRLSPNNGIKQGAPESAEIFGLVIDAMLSELTSSHHWKAFGESLSGLDIEIMFYQDDIFILEKDLGMLGRRIRVVDKCLQRAGLCLATNKTKIIASAGYKGHRQARIGEDFFQVAPLRESLKVLGVSFSFGETPSQQAQELLGRTRAAAAAHRDILTARGAWSKKIYLIKMLVESRFSWAAGALHWSAEDLRCANLLQLHTLRSAFGLRRGKEESWVEWNSRTMRFLRAWLVSHGHPRWSEKILGLQFSLHGHWARRVEYNQENDVATASLPMRTLLWKSTYWWRQQQQLSASSGVGSTLPILRDNLVKQWETSGTLPLKIVHVGPLSAHSTSRRGMLNGVRDDNWL